MKRLFASVAFAISCVFTQQTDALAANHFVSPSGTGVDGSNWKKAWKSPSDIDWTKVNAGDQILLDGGTAGVTYNASIIVPKSGAQGAPITIRQSPQAGHNGPITFYGGATTGAVGLDNAILIQGSFINIIGAQRGGIKINAYKVACVNIAGTGTNNINVKNIYMDNRVTSPPYGSTSSVGLRYSGYNNRILDCDFRNSTAGAREIYTAGVENLTVFNRCSFGCDRFCDGWQRGASGDSILGVNNADASFKSTTHVRNSAFGPYVSFGLRVYSGTWSVADCLFLNSNTAGIYMDPLAVSPPNVRVNQCTFYKAGTPTPPYMISNFPIYNNTGVGTLKVKNSIVYGGTMRVPAEMNINAGGNFQFRVLGSTTALAPSQVDPQFTDDAILSTLPVNFVPRKLCEVSYAVKSISPAVGKGSRLLSTNELCAPYGFTTPIPMQVGGP